MTQEFFGLILGARTLAQDRVVQWEYPNIVRVNTYTDGLQWENQSFGLLGGVMEIKQPSQDERMFHTGDKAQAQMALGG